MAKARTLSPAFDAECREADRPVGFWQWVGYIHGRCRGGYLKLITLGVAILFLVGALILLAPYLGQLTVVLLAGFFLWMTNSGPFRRRRYGRSPW